jgi:hypothetical protein
MMIKIAIIDDNIELKDHIKQKISNCKEFTHDHIYITKKIISLLLFVVLLVGCNQNKTITVSQHLYKISKGNKYCYILGTNHFSKEFDKLDSYTENAYIESDRLILEINLDISESQKYIEKMKINSVEDELNEQQMEEFNKIKSHYKILNNDEITQYNLATISSLCTEDIANEEGYYSKNSIDLYFYNRAISEGKTFDQLETVEFQYELLASLSKEVPEYFLSELSNYNNFSKDINDINDKYYNASKTEWEEFMKEYLNESNYSKDKLYAMNKLANDRNITMTEKIDEYFKDDYISFIGIGASHLEGNNGILSLLQSKGYKIDCLS